MIGIGDPVASVGRLTFSITDRRNSSLRSSDTTGRAFRKSKTTPVSYTHLAAEAQGQPLSNIVFMGMGEPLLNYEQVLRAIERITAQDGLAMSPYRITVSTAGIPEKIRQLADDGVRFNLALSLHAAKETTRTFLMPVNKACLLYTSGYRQERCKYGT